MATQTKPSPVTESIDAAAERVAELNEKAVANGKKAGAAILDTYEKAVVSFTESYEKAAGATKVDWIATAADRPGRLHARAREGVHERRPRARLLDPPPRTARDGRGAPAPRPSAGRPPRRPGSALPRTRCRSPAAPAARERSASDPRGSPPPRRLVALVRLPGTPAAALVTARRPTARRFCAIASSTFSDGSRKPRSICDRYGFEMPARSASWRIESSCSSRWRRMNSPSGDVMRAQPIRGAFTAPGRRARARCRHPGRPVRGRRRRARGPRRGCGPGLLGEREGPHEIVSAAAERVHDRDLSVGRSTGPSFAVIEACPLLRR